MARNHDTRHEFLIRPAMSGALLAAALVIGLPASADQGGDPENRISIFERVEASKGMPTQGEATVVEAAATTEDATRWHDKTESEWRAYHEMRRDFQRRNGDR